MKSRFLKLKLFSPIIVKGEAPYENPWDGGDDYRVLVETEKRKCRDEIYVNACEALAPVVLPHPFERRIFSAVPVVEEKDGRLMLSLNCECYRRLPRQSSTSFAVGERIQLLKQTRDFAKSK